MPATDFIAELEARELLHQLTEPEVRDALKAERFHGYIGFDPTADSLHIGSLLPVLTLMRLQRAGHVPIAVLGGGTGMIGDPSGRDSERQMLDVDTLAANREGLRRQLEQFLDFGAGGAVLVDNAEWLAKISLIDFLRDYGKLFSVNVMVNRESVKRRLESREQGISYTEFSYQLLQAYDFLELYDRYGCRLQLGGSDQWGNIVAGADLVRRLRGVVAHGVTFPLVTRSDGKKFGKSEAGNIWLAPERTSSYRFFQYWLNVDDADVVRYLKFFTFLELGRIDELALATAERPQDRAAQKVLADEVTRLVHGDAALARARHTTEVLFGGGDWRELSEEQLSEGFADSPSSEADRAGLGGPEASLVALVAQSGLSPSKGRARKDVTSGGIYLNNQRVTDFAYQLSAEDLLAGRFAVLRRGKKAYHVLDFGRA